MYSHYFTDLMNRMEKVLDTGGGNPQYDGRASCCLPLDRSSSHPHAGIVCEEYRCRNKRMV
ncbi:MAG: hypothetical protein JWN92_1957 [Candidatus Acidoferrum typicum]|nr:hypothetical protein [Candidatus Acidoferrum typicum]